MKLQRLICLYFLVLFSFNISSSKAYKFYVGGKYGWVVNHSEDYNPWAERNRFQVGDSLFFKYEKGSNSVLLVNKDDYEKCYKKNPLKKFEDGNTVFQIDRSGPYFFISGKDDNCEKGQKLIVVVLAIRPPPPPQTPSTPKAPSPFVLTPSQSPSPISQPPYISTPPSTTPSPISQPPYISAPPTTTPSPVSQPPYISAPPTPSQGDNPISQPPNTYSPDSQPPLAAQTPSGSIIAPAYSPSTQTSLSPYANSPSSTPSVTTPATSPVSDASPPPPSPPSSSSSNETAPAPPNRTSIAWATTPSWLWVYSVITIIVGFAFTTNLG